LPNSPENHSVACFWPDMPRNASWRLVTKFIESQGKPYHVFVLEVMKGVTMINPSLGAGVESNGGQTACKTWGGMNRWSAWEIGAMVAGFVVFWPLGLAALFVKWKFGQLWKGSATGTKPWDAFSMPAWGSWNKQWPAAGMAGSGNAAFDEYRRAQLERLEQERRRLEDEQREFRAFVERLRRAKDQDEFDRFMAERRAAGTTSV
jgi:hypothetical protein